MTKYTVEDLSKGYLDTKWGKVSVHFAHLKGELGYFLRKDDGSEEILLDYCLLNSPVMLQYVVDHELSHMRMARLVEKHRGITGRLLGFLDEYHLIDLSPPRLFHFYIPSGVVLSTVAIAILLTAMLDSSLNLLKAVTIIPIIMLLGGFYLLYRGVKPVYDLRRKGFDWFWMREDKVDS